MKNFTKFLLIFLICAVSAQVEGQERRYLEEVFDDVVVSGLVPMGENYTILNWIATQGQANTLRQPLVGQFYSPEGDTETDRPLVIYFHTGNFFPYPANGSCGGTIGDSSNVEIATRLAKMGYVVAVVNYRQGWNPFDQNELVRRFFLINAAYRGVQDVSTYVRYFRRSVDEFGNPHGINPDKITVWGQGTGGYLSLNAAYLKRYNQILTTSDPSKFILPTGGGPIPMVLEPYNGTIDATGPITVVDASYNMLTQLPIGDTLTIPNHVGYSSDFALTVNMGGALGDSTWIEAGDIPVISFHVTSDDLAPCETDVLNVPTPLGPQPVVEVTGSCGVARIAERLGINAIFDNIPAEEDPYGQFNTTGLSGFYAFNNTPDNSSSPWEWAGSDNPPAICNQDPAIAKVYIDTIIGYFAPRAYIALSLGEFISVKEPILPDAELRAIPNPAHSQILVSTTSAEPIREITMMDINGKVVKSYRNVDNQFFTVHRNDLAAGVYMLHARMDKGVITKKIIFQ